MIGVTPGIDVCQSDFFERGVEGQELVLKLCDTPIDWPKRGSLYGRQTCSGCIFALDVYKLFRHH
jgi:hypothetical protein